MERVGIERLPIDSIRPGPWQPRRTFDDDKLKELARSIKKHGLIYPVMVREVDDGWELISGERRWRASQIAGRRFVPVMITTGTDDELQELALVDNMQREDLTALEEGHGIQALMTAQGYTARQVAQRLGKTNGYVADRLKLLELSDEAVAMSTAHEIPQRTLRDATILPAALQAPALAYLQEKEPWEGQPTTRQATLYLKALAAFWDPEHWTIPLDAIVTPETRNFLELIQQLLLDSEPEEVGPRLVRLRHAGMYDRKNVLTMEPTMMEQRWIVYVLNALEDDHRDSAAYWQQYAPLIQRMCDSCVFWQNEIDERPEIEGYCRREFVAEGAGTCTKYIGGGDPVVIPLSRWREMEFFEQVGEPADLHESNGVGYIDDVDLYARLYTAACKAKARSSHKRAVVQRQKHIEPLEDYASHILEDDRLARGHGMRHDCRRCAHGTVLPGAGSHHLCGFIEDPLPAEWGDGTRAPGFKVLVRKDGLMVPRCEFFHYYEGSMPALARLTGFRLDDRKVAIGWIDAICKTASRYHGYGMVPGVLAWLPYPRAREKAADRKKLLSYLRRTWDEYGDEVIAWMIGAAFLEAKAVSDSGSTRGLFLPNPGSGVEEKWTTLGWSHFAEGTKPYSWPKNWPTPWIEQAPADTEEEHDEG